MMILIMHSYSGQSALCWFETFYRHLFTPKKSLVSRQGVLAVFSSHQERWDKWLSEFCVCVCLHAYRSPPLAKMIAQNKYEAATGLSSDLAFFS